MMMIRWQHLFISYAHADKDVVLWIADALGKSGVNIWMDKKIVGGQVWSADIARAIKTAKAFLLVVSSRSLTSQTVKQEIAYASSQNKTIVPVFIEETNIPDDLALQFSRVHFLYLNRLPPQHQIACILQALRLLGFELMSENGPIPNVDPIASINKRSIEPAYVELKRMSAADVRKKISDFMAMLEAKPDHGYLHLNLGLLHLFMKSYSPAERYLRNALELIPDEPDVYYYLSLVLCKGNRLGALKMPMIKQIEEYLNTAIQMDDAKSIYYFMLAAVYYEYYAVNGLRIPGPDPFDLLRNAQNGDNQEVERLLDSVNIKSEILLTKIRSA
jgi:tetratricopeptide (TPR) repeat protein